MMVIPYVSVYDWQRSLRGQNTFYYYWRTKNSVGTATNNIENWWRTLPPCQRVYCQNSTSWSSVPLWHFQRTVPLLWVINLWAWTNTKITEVLQDTPLVFWCFETKCKWWPRTVGRLLLHTRRNAAIEPHNCTDWWSSDTICVVGVEGHRTSCTSFLTQCGQPMSSHSPRFFTTPAHPPGALYTEQPSLPSPDPEWGLFPNPPLKKT